MLAGVGRSGTVWIPEISNENLNQLAEHIKPVMRYAQTQNGLEPRFDNNLHESPRQNERLYYIQPVDIQQESYTWDPHPTRPAELGDKICDIATYHSYGYYGMFKPSVAEVIAAIPESLRDQVGGFEIISHPIDAADLNWNKQALNDGYHQAITRLYAKVPEGTGQLPEEDVIDSRSSELATTRAQ